jgi:2-oxoisovalerate dehydrogenase E2 component (dihydrolipoyl transacylase)
VIEVDASGLIARRAATGAGGGRPLGWTALFVALVVEALAEHPRLNARVVDERIEVMRPRHVAFAAQTDAGLLAPVVRDADRLAPAEVDAEVRRLTDLARSGRLGAADQEGGTFTVSNSGMYAVDLTTAVINPPQVAILWLGRIRDRPWVHAGGLVVRPVLQMCLTFDHRALDGADAAAFLGTLERLAAEAGGAP